MDMVKVICGYFCRKMKWSTRRLSVMLALLLALTATSTASGADWAANYGGLAGANAYTRATAVDASGNVYLAGYFDGATFTLGSVTLTKIGGSDAFVAKLDASGTVLWAKNFGGSGAYAYGQGIAVDNSGNVYLGGSFESANLTTPALTKSATRMLLRSSSIPQAQPPGQITSAAAWRMHMARASQLTIPGMSIWGGILILPTSPPQH
jgi:hypothetical protein